MPELLILPLDMVDTSGETPSHAQEHEDRLVALASTFRRLWRTMGVTPSSIRARSVVRLTKLGLFGSVNATAANSIWPGWFMRTAC